MVDQAVLGSCVCGAVRYSITPPFVTFQYCHCSRCRKGTGSAHASSVFVKTDHFAWTAGEDQVQRYELPTAKYWCNGFCKTCGSSLPWLSRSGKVFIVPAGGLDDDPQIKPERAIYWGSRAPWYLQSNEVQEFDELPPKR